MSLIDDSRYFNLKFNQVDEVVYLPEKGIQVLNQPFFSKGNSRFLESISLCGKRSQFPADFSGVCDKPDFQRDILGLDKAITRNNSFKYSIIKGPSCSKSKEALIFFHGLNERKWDKYLPWAEILHRLTGKTVILFPIAYHMNRAPESWSEPRLMNYLSKTRKKMFPGLRSSSFANAAISCRLHDEPARFMTSVMQTFQDVVSLAGQIRDGRNPHFDRDASIDFFAYSIGCFLSLIIVMTDPRELFSDSRLCMFCGGAAMLTTRPEGKSIMDSLANKELNSFFYRFLDSEDDFSAGASFDERAVNFFRALLDRERLSDIRDDRLRQLADRLFVIGLQKDIVVPPCALEWTFSGSKGDLPIRRSYLDFEYPYTHQEPFPLMEKRSREIEKSFERSFSMAAAYLS